MEFGFGRFLEMFEERFGRGTTTALLAAIGLGVFGFCLDLIWEHIALPGYQLFLWVSGSIRYFPLTTSEILQGIISGLASGLIIWLLFITVTGVIYRRRRAGIHSAANQARAAIDEVKALIEEAKKDSEKNKAVLDEARSLSDQAQALIKAHLAEFPPAQEPPAPPEGTSPGKSPG